MIQNNLRLKKHNNSVIITGKKLKTQLIKSKFNNLDR
jgi:ATP:corrinoid adenosyltransferase